MSNENNTTLICTVFRPKVMICNYMSKGEIVVPAGSHSICKTLIIIYGFQRFFIIGLLRNYFKKPAILGEPALSFNPHIL